MTENCKYILISKVSTHTQIVWLRFPNKLPCFIQRAGYDWLCCASASCIKRAVLQHEDERCATVASVSPKSFRNLRLRASRGSDLVADLALSVVAVRDVLALSPRPATLPCPLPPVPPNLYATSLITATIEIWRIWRRKRLLLTSSAAVHDRLHITTRCSASRTVPTQYTLHTRVSSCSQPLCSLLRLI